MYLEYTKKEDVNKPETIWHSYKRTNPGRNYLMFGILSKGVRSDIDKGLPSKGIPIEIGKEAEYDNSLLINDKYQDEESFCSLENALEWEKNYGCKITYRKDIPYSVTHPDWHSHSWVNLKEYKYAIELYNELIDKKGYALNPEYLFLLGTMEKMDEMGYYPRIVFWFDN